MLTQHQFDDVETDASDRHVTSGNQALHEQQAAMCDPADAFEEALQPVRDPLKPGSPFDPAWDAMTIEPLVQADSESHSQGQADAYQPAQPAPAIDADHENHDHGGGRLGEHDQRGRRGGHRRVDLASLVEQVVLEVGPDGQVLGQGPTQVTEYLRAEGHSHLEVVEQVEPLKAADRLVSDHQTEEDPQVQGIQPHDEADDPGCVGKAEQSGDQRHADNDRDDDPGSKELRHTTPRVYGLRPKMPEGCNSAGPSR